MSQLQPGKPESIADKVQRIVAPNSGPMTGPGTNSYLLGSKNLALLDPGPDLPEHIDALTRTIEESGGALTDVLVTHTHADHSPAAAVLAEHFGARLVGLPPPQLPRQDQTFVPDHQPADGECLQVGDAELQAVHTPGHASNHVCYWLHSEGLLFTGDHVMQGSTVVIPPPDGDMSAYIASLRKVKALKPPRIAPGHGQVITGTDQYLERLLRHRLQREARVYDRLRGLGQVTTAELLPHAYADVPEQLLPVAQYSLQAHLLKLVADGRVLQQGERWKAL
jgi:glyoxylase-like metal-dependent hydrolase (beta-lactamase superfamily II)